MQTFARALPFLPVPLAALPVSVLGTLALRVSRFSAVDSSALRFLPAQTCYRSRWC
jgi:hypothetical protein